MYQSKGAKQHISASFATAFPGSEEMRAAADLAWMLIKPSRLKRERG